MPFSSEVWKGTALGLMGRSSQIVDFNNLSMSIFVHLMNGVYSSRSYHDTQENACHRLITDVYAGQCYYQSQTYKDLLGLLSNKHMQL